ncbi:MAG: hypothetical protein AAF434_06570 [Pseudomonadota bacterium]
MKIAFLILLLLNGLFFLWRSYFAEPIQTPDSLAAVNAPGLVLLAETGTTIFDSKDIESDAAETGLPSELGGGTAGDSDIVFLNNSLPFGTERERCYSIGPFIESDALDSIQVLLSDNEMQFSVRTLTEPELYGYNVILPPFSDRKEAEKMVEILVDKGVTDYYIIADGELDNAISLGLFREHRFAIRHVAFLEKKGLSPTMNVRYEDRSRHWIDYSESGETLDTITLQRAFPESDIQRLARACP